MVQFNPEQHFLWHSSLAHIVYMITHNLFVRDVYKAKWLCRVKNIVDNYGLSYLWLNQSIIETNQAKQLIHTIIKWVASHNWYTYISTSSMCIMYRLFKKQLDFEEYVLSCNYRERISLKKYRCANSKIPVYNQIYMYATELCTLCDPNENGYEYHYIMICPCSRQSRELYLKHYARSNMLKSDYLFSSENKRTLSRLENSKSHLHFIIVSMLLSAISIILFYVIYNSCSLFVYMW